MNEMLTTRTREQLARWGCAFDEEALYGPAGSDAYDEAIRHDTSEIREIVAIARRARGSILELACGSGRLTLPLLAIRRPVTAVDTSERMLEMLRLRAGRFAASLRTVADDMTAFERPGEFGLVVLGATSVTLLDGAARRRLFARVRRNLTADGLFVVTVAAAYPTTAGEFLALDDERFLSAQIDTVARVRDVNLVVRKSDRAVVYSSRVQLLTAPELIAELEAAGFRVTEAAVGASVSAVTSLSCLTATC